jgi:hypothetical protein
MPNPDVFAFRFYAEQRGSTGAQMWAESEIKRREFLLNQTSLCISILAMCISVIALFS